MTAIPVRYTLQKQERLKSRKAIELLFQKGKSFSIFPFRVQWMLVDQPILLQAGFTVSTRYFKKAVHRNRIKRLMREAYRLQKHPLQLQLQANQQSLVCFFMYNGNELPDHSVAMQKINAALVRLQKITHEAATDHS